MKRRPARTSRVTYQATYTYDPLGRRIAAVGDPDGTGASPPVATWTAYDVGEKRGQNYFIAS